MTTLQELMGGSLASSSPAGGGGAGGGADVASYLNFAQDPTYLAYIRSLDFQKAEQHRVVEDQIARIRTHLAQQIPELQQSGVWGRERLSGGMEARGLYRSGEHENVLNRQRVMEARNLNALNTAAANSIAGLYGNLSNQDAALAQRRNEVLMNTAQNTALYKAQIEQQRQQTAEERAIQSQYRKEDQAQNQQYRAEDRTYNQQQSDKQYAQQQQLYNQQTAAEQARYDQQKRDYDSQQQAANQQQNVPAYQQPGYTGLRPAQ